MKISCKCNLNFKRSFITELNRETDTNASKLTNGTTTKSIFFEIEIDCRLKAGCFNVLLFLHHEQKRYEKFLLIHDNV